jgi:hypothetical protein
MSPVYTNRNGESKWFPKKETNGNLNLGQKDEEKSFIGTVKCVSKMIKMEESNIISEKDVKECIKLNAQHLNINPELLVSLAIEELERESEEN